MSPKIFALGILGFCLLAIAVIGFFFGTEKKPEFSGSDFYPLSQNVQSNQVPLKEEPVTTTFSKSNDQTQNLNTLDGQKVGTVKSSVTATGTTTESCGESGCFEQKFKSCMKATFTTTVGGLGSVKYTIIGAVPGGCQMTFRYLDVPNPSWKNKDLTCTYNNKISLEAAQQETFESAVAAKNRTCSGPLYTIFQEMNRG
jgi:hypothetical protein